MTSLPDKLRALALPQVLSPEDYAQASDADRFFDSGECAENKRLLPLIEALVRVVESAEVIAQYGYPSRMYGTRESLAAVVDEWVTDTREALAELERLVEGEK